MKSRIILVVVLVLAAGSGLARNRDVGSEPRGFDELIETEGRFETTLIHPEADFTRYSKLCPEAVKLEFRDRKTTRTQATTGSVLRKREKVRATPSRENLKTFKQLVSDALVDELERSDTFQLVHDPGPDTLILRATVLDIVSNIPSKSARRVDHQEPFVAEGTIVFDLIDGESGAILVRVGERRKCQRAGDAATPDDASALWSNLCTWAEQAAADFRQELERVRSEELEIQTGTTT